MGSYAEALRVVTAAVSFTLTRDTSWSSKGAYCFQNQIAVMLKRGWGKTFICAQLVYSYATALLIQDFLSHELINLP